MENKEKIDKKIVARFGATVGVSLLLLAIYYFSMNFHFFRFVMWGYMIALAVLVVVYIVYNKGMYFKGVTDEKRALIDGAKRRLDGSRWMLVLIIGFIVTFAVEAILLFVIPWIEGMLK